MPGTLYIVATPIGNMADITLRAIKTLREVDLIAAEDTRVTRNLLSHYGIETHLTPYHLHSLEKKAHELIALLAEGKNVALVSDAGTPGISDPGYELVRAAIDADLPVEVIPGANAITTALVLSGLPTRRFIFEGFPPRKPGDRKAYFVELKNEPRTIVFYESPHRLLATLKAIQAAMGEREVAVCRELTKMFEEVHRGSVSSAIERFTENAPRGEITLVLAGCSEIVSEAEEVSVEDALQAALDEGLSERDAVRRVMEELRLPKRDVYARMLAMKE